MNAYPVELSVVIAAYRSQLSVGELTERLVAVLERLDRSYEIIFVDDASPDGTWQVLCGIEDRYPGRIVLIQLARNTGQHNALMCGLRHVRGRLVITIDDDLQCQPEEIPKLLEKIEREGLDLVYGNYLVKRHNLFRELASIPVGLYVRHTFRMPVRPTSFRVIRREIVELIKHYRGWFTVVDGLLCWATNRIGGVPVEHSPRRHGRSTYTLAKLVLLAFNIFTNFSLLPLRIMAGVGAVLSGGALLLTLPAAWVLRHADTGPQMLAAALLGMALFCGLQLLGLGLLGEYLGRVHLNMSGKPQYVVRQSRGLAGGAGQPADWVSQVIE